MKTLKLLVFCLCMVTAFACQDERIISNEENVIDQTEIAGSNTVSQIVAEQVSTTFRKKNITGLTRHTTAPVKDITTIKDESGSPVMYVVNYANDEGFVIVGATRNYYPILAFSEKGYFDAYEPSMPLGVGEWMEGGQEIIKHQINESCPDSTTVFRELWKMYETPNFIAQTVTARAGNATTWIYQYQFYEYYPSFNYAITQSIQKWNAQGVRYRQFNPGDPDVSLDMYNLAMGLMLDNNPSIAFILTEQMADSELTGPLLTTQWGQGDPYNRFTPHNYLTGCVATAMAQVMRFHRWPNSYDWDLMTDDVATLVSENQKQEVARLMYDVGRYVDTDYGSDGSGASLSNVPSALKNCFQYSNNMKFSDYDFSTVAQEVKARRPVILDGKKDKILWLFPTNGHAWVCDGYSFIWQKEKQTLVVINGMYDPVEVRYIPNESWAFESASTYLHMNWGWSGKYDAWFRPDNFAIKKDDGSVTDYKYNNKMITNIQPN